MVATLRPCGTAETAVYGKPEASTRSKPLPEETAYTAERSVTAIITLFGTTRVTVTSATGFSSLTRAAMGAVSRRASGVPRGT